MSLMFSRVGDVHARQKRPFYLGGSFGSANPEFDPFRNNKMLFHTVQYIRIYRIYRTNRL
jgi:hypothetical protein